MIGDIKATVTLDEKQITEAVGNMLRDHNYKVIAVGPPKLDSGGRVTVEAVVGAPAAPQPYCDPRRG